VPTARARGHARARDGRGRSQAVALEDAARALAEPLRHGLTRAGALLGGGLPGYNLYAAADGWIAVAALEPHFAERLAQALALPALTQDALRQAFAARRADDWERWARELDLPLVAVHTSFPTPSPT
jgi:crotonobetainyl-CoA:carnitine CoA-transferase CaiB-like acyl-CoA transferase